MKPEYNKGWTWTFFYVKIGHVKLFPGIPVLGDVYNSKESNDNAAVRIL